MERLFTRLATATARFTGRPWTFIGCLAIVVIWAVSGPIFKFSETWQLVINTGTTIVTFLMVFLIQNTQNRDACAMQAKLDELVYAQRGADPRFIGIEHLTDEELDAILAEVERRAAEIHHGKPARAIKGKRGVRADEVKAKQPASARPGAKKTAKAS